MAAVAAGAGHAAPERRALTLSLSIDTCVDVDRQEVQRLTELQPHAPPGDTTPAAAAAVQVTITCPKGDGAGDGDVVMSAWDPISGQRVGRTVPLAGTAQVTRPRLLAVSAVELAATVLAEAQARPSGSAPSPTGIDVRETGTEANGRVASTWRMLAFGGAERFPTLGVLAGGGVRLGFDGRGIGGVSLDAQASFGRVATVEGAVALISFSLAPMAGVHKNLGRYTLRAGTGPRLAIGRMDGDVPPSSTLKPLTLTAPWVGWQLQTGFGAAITRHLLVELTIDGGYVVAPLTGRILNESGDVVDTVVVEGAWLGAFLSFGGRAVRPAD